MNKYTIQKAVILGSGVMGSQIAAHCVNAGLQVWLLDLKATGAKPNKTAEDNIKKLQGMKPAPLGLPEYAERIIPGNFEDDMEILAEADWICEAVIEKIDIKQQMMSRIQQYRKSGSIVTTNTSGLPINKIGENCSDELQEHFLGMHFFNPPRYMKLLELIPTAKTNEQVVHYMQTFCEKMLGKGVVLCNDTPNFIANRIGIFSMATIIPYFFDGTFRAEEIDFLTGTLTGYSKAATFRTADLSGLDVIGHVTQNLYPAIPDDERRAVFKLPDAFNKMVEEGLHGNKAGKGFYKKVQTKSGKEYKVLNPDSFEYESQTDPEFESATHAKKKFSTAGERLKFIVNQDDKAGRFLWGIHCELLLYAANRIPEITDSIVSVDRAMKWGFNWELGPFERWDAIGVHESIERMQQEGRNIPESVLAMLHSGRKQFYNYTDGTVYNLTTGKTEPIPETAKGAVTVVSLQAKNKEVMGNEHAGLYDLDDGIALFQFRTKQYTLGFDLLNTLQKACKVVESDFEALVIGHDGDNFSYGANLKEALNVLNEGEQDKIERAVQKFQETAVGLLYQPFPVVAAPFGRALGGGAEFILHADRVVAHYELYIGAVEAGVGLLPAGGGTKELLRRSMQLLVDDDQADMLPYIKKAFKTIGMAKVSDGAPKAKQLGFLRNGDVVVMNKDLLITAAKKEARLLVDQGYHPPASPKIKVLGARTWSALKLMLYIMHESGYITDYDKIVAEKVAWVMSGGNLSEPQEVPEEYLLKLEREAFLELIKDERTQERIEYMLKKGKPLRN